MSKHSVVPEAIHSELSEYTALLRALRTNHIQDLGSHLLQSSTKSRESSVDNNASPTPGATRSKKQVNLWTRWPLLNDDTPIPEWSFDDEVHSIALRTLKEMCMRTDNEDEDDTELEAQLEPVLPYLIQSAYETLGMLLDAAQEQRPSAPKSMVNRLQPMRWQNIVELARFRPPTALTAESV